MCWLLRQFSCRIIRAEYIHAEQRANPQPRLHTLTKDCRRLHQQRNCDPAFVMDGLSSPLRLTVCGLRGRIWPSLDSTESHILVVPPLSGWTVNVLRLKALWVLRPLPSGNRPQTRMGGGTQCVSRCPERGGTDGTLRNELRGTFHTACRLRGKGEGLVTY